MTGSENSVKKESLSPKIGWLQRPSKNSLSKNLESYLGETERLAEQGAELIFLPELALWDYFAITEELGAFDLAVEIEGKEVAAFRRLAKEKSVFIFLPIFERRSKGVYHNTILVLGDQGEIVEVYRKMHIPDDPGFSEKYYFSPGDQGWCVVEVKGMKIGLLICWDQWFPEAARLTAMKGAELLYYPTAIGWDDHESDELYAEQLDAWTTVIRSHSIANGLYTLAVNRTGKEGHLSFWGHSVLVDPAGKKLEEDSIESATHIRRLDLGKIEEQRRVWPFFRDRRIDAYGELSRRWLEN